MNTDLSINLSLTPELSGELNKSSGMLAYIKEAYPLIEDGETSNLCAADRKNCLAVVARLKELKTGFVAPAKQIIAQAEALFDGPMDNAKAAADHCGTLLLGWQAKEAERVAAERRKQDEAERKIRAEAEAKAAAIRAKAEQEAREATRKAAEAQEAIRKAEAEGNAKEAAKAAAAAAKQAAEAESRAEADRAKAAQIEAEATARVAAMPTAEVAKTEGFGGRKNWKAELAVPTEQDAIMAIVKAIPQRPELIAFLTLDMTALHKAAKSYENNMNIPGVRAVNKVVAVSK